MQFFFLAAAEAAKGLAGANGFVVDSFKAVDATEVFPRWLLTLDDGLDKLAGLFSAQLAPRSHPFPITGRVGSFFLAGIGGLLVSAALWAALTKKVRLGHLTMSRWHCTYNAAKDACRWRASFHGAREALIARQGATIQRQEEELNAAQVEIQRLKAESSASREETRQSQWTTEVAWRRRAELQNELHGLRMRNWELRAAVGSSSTTVAVLERAVYRLHRERQTPPREMQVTSQRQMEQVGALQAAVEAERATLRSTVADAKTKQEKLEQLLSESQSLLLQKESAMQQSQEQVTALSAALESVKQRSEQVTALAAALTSDNKRLSEQVTALEKALLESTASKEAQQHLPSPDRLMAEASMAPLDEPEDDPVLDAPEDQASLSMGAFSHGSAAVRTSSGGPGAMSISDVQGSSVRASANPFPHLDTDMTDLPSVLPSRDEDTAMTVDEGAAEPDCSELVMGEADPSVETGEAPLPPAAVATANWPVFEVATRHEAPFSVSPGGPRTPDATGPARPGTPSYEGLTLAPSPPPAAAQPQTSGPVQPAPVLNFPRRRRPQAFMIVPSTGLASEALSRPRRAR